MMRRLALGILSSTAAACAIFAAAQGCAELPDLKADACGNAIVEPDRGEDCDTFGTEPQTTCRAAGKVGECHFDCTVDDAGNGPSCPAGWGCGTDGLCRLPTGVFTASGDVVQAPHSRLLLADFDGDGRRDVLSSAFHELGVTYLDEGSRAGKTLLLTTSEPVETLPAVSDLDGDGRSDLALSAGTLGLGVLLGDADRTLASTVQSSISTANAPGVVWIMPIDMVRSKPGDEMILGVASPAAFVAVEKEKQVLFLLPQSPAELAGPARVAQFWAGGSGPPCEQFAAAFTGASTIEVYTPCTEGDAYVDKGSPHEVDLPGIAKITSGIQVGDVNGDGHLDLVADVEKGCVGVNVAVAFGVGDGTFDSHASVPAASGDDQASCFDITIRPALMPGQALADRFPLSMGDLNGDGRADFVSSFGVFLSGPPDPGDPSFAYDQSASSNGVTWTQAVIADFNDDGTPDVIAGAADLAGIDFFNGAGDGLFNHFTIPTGGGASHFVTGDFDGDLVRDLALVLKDELVSSEDSLEVMFGRTAGAPEAPVDIGKLPSIDNVLPGENLARLLLATVQSGPDAVPLDATTDLAVISTAEDGVASVSILPGSTDRRLESPYLLFDGSGVTPRLDTPQQAVSGHFTGGEHPDVAVLGRASGPGDSYRLWMIQTAGEGKLVSAGEPAALGADYDGREPSLASADLDRATGEGGIARDELVFATSAGGGQKGGLVLVFHVDASAGGFGEPTVIATEEPLGARAPIELSDLDADGFLDLVLLSIGKKAGDDDRLFVLWNDGQGGFSDDRRSTLDLGADGGYGRITAFASLAADTDAARELAIVVGGRIYLADPVRSEAMFTLRPEPRSVLEGFVAVAAADLDGDGLDDLAAGDGASIHLLLQGKGAAQ